MFLPFPKNRHISHRWQSQKAHWLSVRHCKTLMPPSPMRVSRILMNADGIVYNQEGLGVSASFRKSLTAEGYEVWAGPLTGGRTVAAMINLSNESRTLTLDSQDVGLQNAGKLKDIWNSVMLADVVTSYLCCSCRGTWHHSCGARCIYACWFILC